MSTIGELLDAAKARTGSDYATAQALGVPRQKVSNWRHGLAVAQPEDHALVADLAGQDPHVALVRATLAKHQDTPKGERLITALGKRFRAIGEGVTLLFLASAGFFGHSREAIAGPYTGGPTYDNVYYVKC